MPHYAFDLDQSKLVEFLFFDLSNFNVTQISYIRKSGVIRLEGATVLLCEWGKIYLDEDLVCQW